MLDAPHLVTGIVYVGVIPACFGVALGAYVATPQAHRAAAVYHTLQRRPTVVPVVVAVLVIAFVQACGFYHLGTHIGWSEKTMFVLEWIMAGISTLSASVLTATTVVYAWDTMGVLKRTKERKR